MFGVFMDSVNFQKNNLIHMKWNVPKRAIIFFIGSENS